MKIFFIFALFYFSQGAYGYDEALSDFHIKKVEKVYGRLPASHPSKKAVSLRLADLLSKKSVYLYKRDLNSGCTDCTMGVEERKKALSLYNQALKETKDPEKISKITLQIGRIYEMTQKNRQAIKFYNKALKLTKKEDYLIEAHLSLGDMHSKEGQIKRSLYHYEKVYRKKNAAKRPVAAYKRAWALFNLGKVSEGVKGLTEILKTPDLLKRPEFLTKKEVEDYQIEVARDLATFLSKSDVKDKDIVFLYNLTPKKQALANLSYLGSELERVGLSKQAMKVWKFTLDKQTKHFDQLESLIQLTHLNRKNGDFKSSSKYYAKALSLWKKYPCKGQSCSEIKTRLRKHILDWNHEEKDDVSEDLLNGYVAYLEVFDKDIEIQLWLAQNLKLKKRYQKAYEAYSKVVNLLDSGLKFKTVKDVTREGLLLIQVEIAESSKDKNLLGLAYKRYLKISKERSKALEVSYQMAYLDYKDKKYKEAAEAFQKVALMNAKKDAKGIREKAADLSLDALVLAKDDQGIETWSQKFAELFPKNKKSYSQFLKTAQFNQMEKSSSSAEKSWTVLKRFDLNQANEKEKLKYYKNKLVLSEKLKKMSDFESAVNYLYGKMNSLSKKERNWVIQRKFWFVEMSLQFEATYDMMLKHPIVLKELSEEQRLLKKALFAKLSKKSPEPYQRKYVKVTKDEKKKQAMAISLIKASPNPLKELKTYRAILKKDKGTYNQMHLEYLGKTYSSEKPVYVQFKRYMTDKAYKDTYFVKFFKRQKFLDTFYKAEGKIKGHALDLKNQRTLKTSLLKRIRLIDELQGHVNKGVALEDWMAQVTALKSLSGEYQRLYKEILSLPMPEGLNEKEQMEYMALLNQQASSYKVKGDEVEKKYISYWNEEKVISKLKENYDSLKKHFPSVVKGTYEKIAQIAPQDKKPSVEAIFKTQNLPEKQVEAMVASPPKSQEGFSFKKWSETKSLLRKNPFDKNLIKALIKLSEEKGDKDLSDYLKQRLENKEMRQLATAKDEEGAK